MNKKLLLCTIAAAVLGFSAQAAMAQQQVVVAHVVKATHVKAALTACMDQDADACTAAINENKEAVASGLKDVTKADVQAAIAACAAGTPDASCAKFLNSRKGNLGLPPNAKDLSSQNTMDLREAAKRGPDAFAKVLNKVTGAAA